MRSIKAKSAVRRRTKPAAEARIDVAGLEERARGAREARDILLACAGKIDGTEFPGGAGKVPVGPGYLTPDGEGHAVEDPWGGTHAYPPKG